MRHRAAMGLTEETDAVVVVVSEETGEISVAHRGHLVQGLDVDGLTAFLTTTLTSVSRRNTWLADLTRRIFGNAMMREAVAKEDGSGGPAEMFESQDGRQPREPSDKHHEEAKS